LGYAQQQQQQQQQSPFTQFDLPTKGWVMTTTTTEQSGSLQNRFDYLMVNDTYEIFVQKNTLQASSHSDGFKLYDDRFGRFGWIATNPNGGETIQFDIHMPQSQSTDSPSCYIPVLSVVKSYANMGSFTVTVKDLITQQELSKQDYDALWKPRISVPQDLQLLEDNGDSSNKKCRGHCAVIVTTHPKHPDRDDNKVKIVTLAVRKCAS
jgi:hypothetical protein